MGKKIRACLIVCAFSFCLPLLESCEENIQVLAPPEFIPVVYCLLNPSDTVQTVRISRVFQDRNEMSAWEKRYDGYIGDSLNQIYLETVGEQGVYETRDFTFATQTRQSHDSIFACTYLFTAAFKPEFSKNYNLYIYFPETRIMVSSNIQTLSKVHLIDPAMVPGRKVVIDPSQPYVIRWTSAVGTSYYQGIFHVNYLEEETGQITGKSICMPMRIVLQYSNHTELSQEVGGVHLLQTLKEQIPVKDGVRRKLTNLDFSFYYGGDEIALFANSGMNPKGPEGMVLDFSNFDNARGIFSSISSIEVKGLTFSNQAIDTIANHFLTKQLNFLTSNEDF
jgi:hypothetical protein